MGLITITKSKVPTPTTAPEIQAATATSSEPATVAEPMLTASATPDIATPDAITSQAPVRRKRVRGKRLRQASVDPEMLVMNDIARVLGLGLDAQALYGVGTTVYVELPVDVNAAEAAPAH